MNRLVIDADSFIIALENHEPGSRYYLDLQTGEVLFLSFSSYMEVDEETQEKVESDPERYISIDSLPSSVSWQVMSDSIDSLPDSEAKERLGSEAF